MFKKTFSSKDQFGRDFQEHPPRPLIGNDELSSVNVEVVDVTSWNTAGILWELLKKALAANRANDWSGFDIHQAQTLKPVIKALSEQWAQTLRPFQDYIKAIKHGTIIDKIKSSFGMLFLGLMIIALLVVVVPYYLFKFRRLPYTLAEGKLGFVMFSSDFEGKIYVQRKLIESRNRNVEAVISHEHIHVLQHHYWSSYVQRNLNQLGSLNTTDFIKLDSEYGPTLLYLMDRFETEARLHELVISHYRQRGTLPINHLEFITMLMECGYVRFFLHEGRPEVLKRFKVNAKTLVDARDAPSILEIVAILNHINDDDVLFTYLNEALPWMYSNLLYYYGDACRAKQFSETIPDSGFMDYLYKDPKIIEYTKQ